MLKNIKVSEEDAKDIEKILNNAISNVFCETGDKTLPDSIFYRLYYLLLESRNNNSKDIDNSDNKFSRRRR